MKSFILIRTTSSPQVHKEPKRIEDNRLPLNGSVCLHKRQFKYSKQKSKKSLNLPTTEKLRLLTYLLLSMVLGKRKLIR